MMVLLSPVSRLFQTLFTLLFMLVLLPPNQAIAKSDFKADYRPQCAPGELVQNMCFNRNMEGAVKFMDSDRFEETFDEVVESARLYLEKQEPAKNKVVLFDLDETILDNREYYLEQKTFDQQTWNEWVADKGVGRYNDDVYDLMKTAKEKGFAVMFITGRPAYLTEETLAQIPGMDWNGVFLKPTGMHVTSTEYKTKIRKALRDMGFEIVINVGDQPSDFDLPVKRAEGEFLLPNVMYYIP